MAEMQKMWAILVSVLTVVFAFTCRPVVTDEGVQETTMETGFLSTPTTTDVESTPSSQKAVTGEIAQDLDFVFPNTTLASNVSVGIEEGSVNNSAQSVVDVAQNNVSLDNDVHENVTSFTVPVSTSTPPQISDSSEVDEPENETSDFSTTADIIISEPNASRDSVSSINQINSKMVDSVQEKKPDPLPPPPPTKDDAAQPRSSNPMAKRSKVAAGAEVSMEKEEKERDEPHDARLENVISFQQLSQCEVKFIDCQEQTLSGSLVCPLEYKECLRRALQVQGKDFQKRFSQDLITNSNTNTNEEASLSGIVTNLVEAVQTLVGKAPNQGLDKTGQPLVSSKKKCPFLNEPVTTTMAPNVVPSETCDTPLVPAQSPILNEASTKETLVPPIVETMKEIPSSSKCECMQSLSESLISGLSKGITDGLSSKIQEILMESAELRANVLSIAETLDKTLSKLTSTLNTLVNSALSSLLGDTGLLKTELGKVTDLLKALPLKDVSQTLTGTVSGLVGNVDNVLNIASDVLKNTTKPLENLLGSTLNVIENVPSTVVKPVVSLLNDVTNTVGTVGTLTSAVGSAIPIDTIKDAVKPVESLIAGVSDTAGGLLNSVGTVANTLNPVTSLTSPVTSLTGVAVSPLASLAGAVNPVAALTGTAGTAASLAGAINPVASLTGTAGAAASLAGAFNPLAALTGTAGTAASLAGAINPVASLTGTAGTAASLAGEANPISSVIGLTGTATSLASAMNPISSVNGASNPISSVAGVANPISSVTNPVGTATSLTDTNKQVSTLTSATNPISTLTGATSAISPLNSVMSSVALPMNSIIASQPSKGLLGILGKRDLNWT